MLEVRNITFSIGQKPILKDVSFVASPGEVVGIVGANGAGKTTLLRLLSTLDIPDGGKVIFEGADIYHRPLKYRRNLGYMPEKVALYEDMTVKEYLTYRSRFKGEVPKRVRRRVSEVLELCHLTEFSSKLIAPMSYGLKKRVALADALMLRPRILLLDDCLAGLDSAMRSITSEILVNASSFSCVVITGHEFSDMVSWTNRFVVLSDGVSTCEVTSTGVEKDEVVKRLSSLTGGGLK